VTITLHTEEVNLYENPNAKEQLSHVVVQIVSRVISYLAVNKTALSTKSNVLCNAHELILAKTIPYDTVYFSWHCYFGHTQRSHREEKMFTVDT